jgi:hypothetical protein
VMPAGVATGVSEAIAFAVVGEVCAGKLLESATNAMLKRAKRRIIREFLTDYRRDWKPVHI